MQYAVVRKEDMAYEAAMAQNLVLEYGGVTPAMAVMSRHPRAFYEFEDETITSMCGVNDSTVELFESMATGMTQRF